MNRIKKAGRNGIQKTGMDEIRDVGKMAHNVVMKNEVIWNNKEGGGGWKRRVKVDRKEWDEGRRNKQNKAG